MHDGSTQQLSVHSQNRQAQVRACLVARICVAWSVSMGLAHLSQAKHMHALMFGCLHVDSLVWKRRFFVIRMSITHVIRMC